LTNQKVESAAECIPSPIISIIEIIKYPLLTNLRQFCRSIFFDPNQILYQLENGKKLALVPQKPEKKKFAYSESYYDYIDPQNNKRLKELYGDSYGI